MPEVTVLRVEVSEGVGKETDSLNSNKETSSSLAAGATTGEGIIGKKKVAAPSLEYATFLGRGMDEETRKWIREDSKLNLKEAFSRDFNKSGESPFNKRGQAFRAGAKGYLSNLEKSSYIKGGVGMATSATAIYSLYSNYQKTGYELSGATHAAAIQGRKSAIANTGLQLGAAALITPALAVPVIAMKAYQLSQTNRKEIFEIRKSQVQSQVLQQNLIKNVAERRF